MRRRTIFFTLTFLAWASLSREAKAEFIVDGEVRGNFCTLGLACTFRRVDAISSGQQPPRPFGSFPVVSSYERTKNGHRCIVNIRGNAARHGWWTNFWEWLTDAPEFYVTKAGKYERIGTPEYIVFKCIPRP